MLLDITALSRLHAGLTSAHLPDMRCPHPKRELRICARCQRVLCAGCADPEPHERGWCLEDSPSRAEGQR